MWTIVQHDGPDHLEMCSNQEVGWRPRGSRSTATSLGAVLGTGRRMTGARPPPPPRNSNSGHQLMQNNSGGILSLSSGGRQDLHGRRPAVVGAAVHRAGGGEGRGVRGAADRGMGLRQRGQPAGSHRLRLRRRRPRGWCGTWAALSLESLAHFATTFPRLSPQATRSAPPRWGHLAVE